MPCEQRREVIGRAAKEISVRPLESRASSKVTASSFASLENRTEGLSFCGRMGTHSSFISPPFLRQEERRACSHSVESSIPRLAL
uniref:Uncharacterized protein n=1 Tax=Marmota marmota marmota TaxID=9994 RepID=A0A8C6A4J6_MARMA